MTKAKLLFSLSIAVLLCCLRPFTLQAQTPQLVVVNSVVTQEGADSLGLSVFFTVTDGNGRPIPNPNIESATIQLLGPNNEPVSAIVDDPQTPVYIALLIDGSGSMQNVIGDVRAAAQSAINSAPPTAYFAVIQFNQEFTVLQDFTNDLNRVKNAINQVEAVPNRGTCLYDSVYNAINLLDDQIQSQEERRAIILFTDGKDQLRADSPEPCSQQTYNDVINAARPGDITRPITPIHTIGLFDASGSNLNEAELRGMAVDTIAFSAIGNATNLNSLFQQILDGLNSQLVARANVFASQGENQGVLAVKVRDVASPLTTTFNFFSNTAYDAPPPPVNTQISSLQYDEASNVYLLSLSVANAEEIYQLIVNVWDVRRGTQVTNDQIFENLGSTLLVEIDASNFEPEREYSIHVQAIDEDGFLIADEEGETLLAEREIVYDRELPQPVEFTIQSVNADYENGLLFIDVDVPDNGRVQTYEGFIVDETTGGKIYDFGPRPFASGRIQESLPDVIQSSEVLNTYRVTVYLTTQENLRSEASYDDFKPVPPEPPGTMARIMAALGNNPAIAGSIVVIILAITGFFVFQNQRSKRNAPPPPRPPVDKTMIFNQASDYSAGQSAKPAKNVDDWFEDEPFLAPAPERAVLSPRLLLKVSRSPGMSAGLEKTITQFPAAIGREDCEVNIVEDRRISRRHVEISVQNGEIMIADLGSRNGTYLNDVQLTPYAPVPVKGFMTIRLGSQTYIELEPLLI
ncbi:MAG: VWA domain-containing protein [Ardenticatenaceae bacterium]|nr:VWA domain-containing protein [Ardenticatenaceae bacterium]MCB9446603.1 VWA domain-containing protein [Ardenticatenaceae bacterium]